jgi:glycosyltransferase involved in cell wall biosynthesis
MEKIPCSVGMLTFNSEKTLRRALDSVKDFDEIILCDGGSTDDTLAIAEQYGAVVIPQDQKYKYANNTLADGGGARNQMITIARNDWFLMLDSDENISQGLHDDIARIARAPYGSGSPLVYRIPIHILIDGRLIKYSSNYPGYQPRFYNKKSGARYIRPVHNRMSFNPGTPFGTLAHPWFVYFDSRQIGFNAIRKPYFMRSEIEQAGNQTWPDFMRHTVYFQTRAFLGITLKALYNYLRYGFRDTMPISVEMARAWSPLRLVFRSTIYRIRKAFA